MHFGDFLTTLREARGLTQAELARAAEVAPLTIQRGEGKSSKRCPWKPSTARDVFEALNRFAHLSENERENYLQLSGMTALAASKPAPVVSGRPAPAPAADPDRTTAHTWIELLLQEAGSVRVLAAMEALAASWAIDLPPRARRDDAARTGAWIYHAVIEEDGVRARILAPIQPPPSHQQPSATKRRAAAN